MSIGDFNRQVEALWAAHFGCAREDFGREGTTLLPRDRLQGGNVIHIIYIRKHALAEIDPALKEALASVLQGAGEKAVLSSELLLRTWGKERIGEVDAGLIFHLRPGELVRPAMDVQFTLRRLTGEDQSALEALRARCTEHEIDDAYVEIDHDLAWGCFRGEQLVAVGSAYPRNGFMDYGVLTDPELRGQGLARHVVSALADDTVERGLIPQYRCNRANKASRRVAEAAGFTLYYTTESVKLKG
jgi:RimJ/RimL family protein N-acetyltransferase